MNKAIGYALDQLHLINLQSITWKVFLVAEVAVQTSPANSPIARIMITCHLWNVKASLSFQH